MPRPRRSLSNPRACRHLLQEWSVRGRACARVSESRSQEQLARAFGLGSEADVEALIATLRAGGDVDVAAAAHGLPRAGRQRARHAAPRTRSATSASRSRSRPRISACGNGTSPPATSRSITPISSSSGRKRDGDHCPIADLAKLVHPGRSRGIHAHATRDVLTRRRAACSRSSIACGTRTAAGCGSRPSATSPSATPTAARCA